MNGFILHKALAEVCKTSGKKIYTMDDQDKSPEWLVVSYKKDFDYLWHREDLWKWIDGKGQRNILLVWDGMPEPDDSGVNVLDHITPVDWAMALSHRLLQRGKKDIELRILICDISQQNHTGAFAVRMLPAICHCMPWFRVYCPIESGKWFGRSFDALVDDISQLVPGKFASLKDAQSDLVESLIHAWIGSVTESGSHHDVSNLLGPLVLSIGFNDSSLRQRLLENKQARIALLQKIKWLGMGGGAEKTQDKWFDFSKSATKITRDGRVKIILIDDQANHGWLDTVIAAVGANRSNNQQVSGERIECFAKSDVVEVLASKSYHAIRNRLDESGIGQSEDCPTESADLRFKFSLTGEGAEILLLDLRLFFNGPDEIEYFKWALGIAKNLKLATEKALPELDCGKLEKWIKKANESKSADWSRDTEYLELLTLLPRILATIDMSLPIVIFSSTGQRKVTEAFKSYGNIITVFEKPRFFGYATEDVVHETANKFKVAMNKALDLARARSAVQRIQQAAANPMANGLNNPEELANQYVEVFIDESGTVNNGLFVVGGVALVHKDEQQATELDTYMSNHSFELNGVNYNLRWNGEPGKNGERKLPKHFVEKNPSGEADEVKKLLPIFEMAIKQFSTKFFTFSLSAHIADTDSFDPLNNTNLDNVYLRLVREVADGLAYEFLPYHINGSFDLKICAATRKRYKKNEIYYTPDECNKLRTDYGVIVWDQKCFSSMQPASLVPMMADIISTRSHSDLTRPKITGAIAVELNYRDDLEPRLKHQNGVEYPVYYRNAHHLADIVAYFARVSRENQDWDILSKFGYDRMVDDFEESGFPEVIYAGKCLDAGDLAEALLFAHAAIEKDPRRQFKNGITSKVCLRINNALENMVPNQFMAFATGLDDSRKFTRMRGGAIVQHNGSQMPINADRVIPLDVPNASLADRRVRKIVEDSVHKTQSSALQKPEVKAKQVASDKEVQRQVNKGASNSRHNSTPAAKMQSHESHNKKTARAESVFVQSVEADGFWVTFHKNNIGEINKVSNPPSGWCPSNGQAAPPDVGDEIKVVFTPGLGNREGYCFVTVA